LTSASWNAIVSLDWLSGAGAGLAGFVCESGGVVSGLRSVVPLPERQEITLQPPSLYDSADILTACGIAFGAVFVLLITLSAIMQLITLIFPEEQTALPAPARSRAGLPKAASVPPPVPSRRDRTRRRQARQAEHTVDPPVVAAIATAVAAAIPGAKVIRIEEKS
jgi:hypothetical protein